MSKRDYFSWLGFSVGILCLAASPRTHAQNASPRVEWEKTFGGRHGGFASDVARSVKQTADGGYIVAGYTTSFGAGSYDVYLIKLDADGELDPRWAVNPRTFGGGEWDEASSVAQTADGGYIVAGKTGFFGAVGRDV